MNKMQSLVDVGLNGICSTEETFLEMMEQKFLGKEILDSNLSADLPTLLVVLEVYQNHRVEIAWEPNQSYLQ